MRLIIKKTPDEFDRAAALEVTKQVVGKPDSVIGLATGNTTVGLHKEMVRLHNELGIDYSKVTTFNLDEYAGVSGNDPASCGWRINDQLLKHLNIDMGNTHIPNGMNPSPEAEMDNYAKLIRDAGGIDLQIISIGENGHIAFNEPGTPFDTTMHIADISDSTVRVRSVMFGGADRVPRKGITVGIKDIMHSKRIIFLAKGKQKANIVYKALCRPITTDVPASVLQLHPDLTVILDEEAAEGIHGCHI